MKTDKENFVQQIYNWIISSWNYLFYDVWKDKRHNKWVSVVKTLSLSISTFTDSRLQVKSMALTYSTVLAIVPGFALLLAIGRGFGLSDLIRQGLFEYFPAQQKAVSTALGFVDSYLNQASQGVFVGVGIVFLLWTLISLLSYIEDSFNSIWDITKSRSIYQKITDYIAICMMIPILMICSSGISIFVSTVVQDNLNLPFLSPLVNSLLELAPAVLAWLAFTLSFFLIPNTKVEFKYAAISGLVCAVAYQIVQLLFVNGQIYVSKYNAIYGSFSFLPLLLIWLQLSWLILLFGCVLTFSLQNVFAYNYSNSFNDISEYYKRELTLFVTSIVYKNFVSGKKALSNNLLSKNYNIPVRLVNTISQNLVKCGIVYMAELENDVFAMTPALDPSALSVGDLFYKLDKRGQSGFVAGFSKEFGEFSKTYDEYMKKMKSVTDSDLVYEIELKGSLIK